MGIAVVFGIIGMSKSVHRIVFVTVMARIGRDIIGLPFHMANIAIVERCVVIGRG